MPDLVQKPDSWPLKILIFLKYRWAQHEPSRERDESRDRAGSYTRPEASLHPAAQRTRILHSSSAPSGGTIPRAEPLQVWPLIPEYADQSSSQRSGMDST